MNAPAPRFSGGEVANVLSLVAGRMAVASLLLVTVSVAAFIRPVPFPITHFTTVLALAWGVSLASLLIVRSGRQPSHFASFQIGCDLILETVLVYVTGGPYSVFAFLYLLSVMATSYTIAPRRSFATAVAGVLLHGMLLNLLLYGVIPTVAGRAPDDSLLLSGSVSLLVILGNVSASLTVAYLSARFASRLHQARRAATQSQADLAELRVLHEDIIQSLASGVVTVDGRGRVATANRAAGVIGGVAPDTLVGRPWGELFGSVPTFDEVRECLERTGSGAKRFDASLRRGDGTRIPIGVSASPLTKGGEKVGIICSFQDLTEIQRMEVQVRRADRLAAVGSLAAGLAHEIRNPLLSISGSIEELRGSLNPQGADRELMEIVLRESDRLNGIITEFLEFSRSKPIRREVCDLGEILEEQARLLKHHKRMAPGTRIVMDYERGALKVPLDPTQIRQTLWNLCLNALEAMPSGGELSISSTIHSWANSGEGRPFDSTLEIIFADTGVGIPPETLPHIFEPFYSTKDQGIGLGLSIVHRIIQEHGGKIEVESRVGRGTTFSITIPVSEGA